MKIPALMQQKNMKIIKLRDGNDPVGQLMHKIDQRGGHHRQQNEQRREHGQDFRNENEGHFLDLGQRLNQGHRHPHDQPDNHHRRPDLDGQPDRFLGQIKDFGLSHTGIVPRPRKNTRGVKNKRPRSQFEKSCLSETRQQAAPRVHLHANKKGDEGKGTRRPCRPRRPKDNELLGPGKAGI